MAESQKLMSSHLEDEELREKVGFKEILASQFHGSESEFFSFLFKEKKQVHDLLKPGEVKRVSKKLQKWILTMREEEHPSLYAHFGRVKSKSKKSKKKSKNRSKSGSRVEKDGEVTVDKEVTKAGVTEEAVSFKKLLASQFHGSESEFFSFLFKEKKQVHDLLKPGEVKRVSKKLQKWILTMREEEHPSLYAHFGRVKSKSKKSKKKSKNRSKSGSRVEEDGEVTVEKEVTKAAVTEEAVQSKSKNPSRTTSHISTNEMKQWWGQMTNRKDDTADNEVTEAAVTEEGGEVTQVTVDNEVTEAAVTEENCGEAVEVIEEDGDVTIDKEMTEAAVTEEDEGAVKVIEEDGEVMQVTVDKEGPVEVAVQGRRKRKTPSIMNIASRLSSESEDEEGPYMKSVKERVDDLAKGLLEMGKSIKGNAGKQLECDKEPKPAESERDNIVSTDSENEIIPDSEDNDSEILDEEPKPAESERDNIVSTDSENEILPDSEDNDSEILDPQIFGSPSSDEDENQIEEPEEHDVKIVKTDYRKTKQQKLDLFMTKRSAGKRFDTKDPQSKFGGLSETAGSKKQAAKKQKFEVSDDDDDPDYQVSSQDESDEGLSEDDGEDGQDSTFQTHPSKSKVGHRGKSKGDEQKAGEDDGNAVEKGDDSIAISGDNSEEPTKKKPVKNPGRGKRRKINCPQCNKILAKCRSVLVSHYRTFHSLVPNDERDDQIMIVTKRLMPLRKDGTRSSDINVGKDTRNRRRVCYYCEQPFSVSHLRGNHLRVDSTSRCKAIPSEELEGVDTEEKRKKWTSVAISKSKITSVAHPKFRDVYAGDTYFTIDELLDKAEVHARSYQGKLYIPKSIREKLRKKQRLTPEEHKINYRSKSVRNMQKRVMDHIFGNRKFQLKQIDEVCKWMKGTDAEEAFFNSRLIRMSKDQPKDAPLSDSTIGSLARSMLELLKFVQSEYTDMEVKAAAARAIESVKNIERTSVNLSIKRKKRRGYLEPENYLLPLDQLQQFIESKAHTDVINKASQILEADGRDERAELARQLYARKEVYTLQCHLAVMLTLHTGKRPGVLCGIKIADIDNGLSRSNVKEFRAEEDPDNVSFQFRVVPSCEYAVFKTVAISHVNVSERMLELLEMLGYLRVLIDGADVDDRLFTSFTCLPLSDIDTLMKKAWSDAGLKSRFNSTMMRHTIVTRARDPANKLSVEQLKALARGMDHSVQIAESTYYHEKEKGMVDHSKVIERVLKLNDWNTEIELGIQEEIEGGALAGEVDLFKDGDKDDEEEEDQAEEPPTKKRKIGRMEVIFTEAHSRLVARMFREFIEDRVENAKKSILTSEILDIYNRNMSGITSKSPYAELFQYGEQKIVQKVRTLITQGKRRKTNEERKAKAYEEARLQKPENKAKGKK